jgi:hypothetical protein
MAASTSALFTPSMLSGARANLQNFQGPLSSGSRGADGLLVTAKSSGSLSDRKAYRCWRRCRVSVR